MVYKCLNGLAPKYLSSTFIQRNDIITSYDLRDSENKLATVHIETNGMGCIRTGSSSNGNEQNTLLLFFFFNKNHIG